MSYPLDRLSVSAKRELAIFVAVSPGFPAVLSTLEFPPAWGDIGAGGRRVNGLPVPEG